MKRTRFGSRDRLSRDAAELQRLATGLSESGGKLEDAYWETQLVKPSTACSRTARKMTSTPPSTACSS